MNKLVMIFVLFAVLATISAQVLVNPGYAGWSGAAAVPYAYSGYSSQVNGYPVAYGAYGLYK